MTTSQNNICYDCIHLSIQNHGRKYYCDKYQSELYIDKQSCNDFLAVPKRKKESEITYNINNINEIIIEKKLVFTVADREMNRKEFFDLMSEFIHDTETDNIVNGICDFIETIEKNLPPDTKIIIITPEKK